MGCLVVWHIMDIRYYLHHLGRLHTAKYKGKQAPHKAVLLLAVMELVERGEISSPEVELTDELVECFQRIWSEKLPASCPFTCDIGKPFYHMQHEPFWRLVEHSEETNMVAEALGLYNNETKPLTPGRYGVKYLREQFRCARIDNELYELMKDAEARQKMQELLVSRYLNYDPPKSIRTLSALSLGLFGLLIA